MKIQLYIFVTSKNSFNNYDELINSDLVDAIYISTVNNTHFELISKCAKSKKHIFNPDNIRIPYEGKGGYQNSGNGVKIKGKIYKPNESRKYPIK